MLALAFFISVFSTLTWLIFAIAYVSDHLNGVSFGALGIIDISIYLSLILLPILILWMVFGFINQYLSGRSMTNNMFSLFKQMKKNQDYTDLIARIMLEAEQEIKDGFILNKFDLFVSDLNELIADLIQRCNIASPEQIDHLWLKVQNGGKWAFGKVLIDVNQSQQNFQMRIFEKSKHDNVIAGTVLELCARYLSLCALLEKHDKERVFITIIETGVFGKVFSILAPISDEIRRSREYAPSGPMAPSFANQSSSSSFSEEAETVVVQKPKPGFSRIHNEDDNQNFEQIDTRSFVTRMNPFRKKDTDSSDDRPQMQSHERDPLSLALERSFGNDVEIEAPKVSAPVFEDQAHSINFEPEVDDPVAPRLDNEPRFEISLSEKEREFSISAPKIEREDVVIEKEEKVRFANNTQKTLNDLKKEWEEMRTVAKPTYSREEMPAPSLREESRTREEPKLSKAAEAVDEDFTYPFGGWTDEGNYNK